MSKPEDWLSGSRDPWFEYLRAAKSVARDLSASGMDPCVVRAALREAVEMERVPAAMKARMLAIVSLALDDVLPRGGRETVSEARAPLR